MIEAVGLIPSRYGSTRLPGKALALIHGVPLVQHVYERAKQAKLLDDVIIATDDERITAAAAKFGGKAVMTSAAHQSGTDRLAEVARKLDAQVIVNIQGDEPLMRPEQIDQVVEFALAHGAVPVTTLRTALTRQEDVTDPNVVKVVVDRDGYALYFSRAPIPYHRQVSGSSRSEVPDTGQPAYWKHLGIYGYQRHFLLQFPHLAPTPLERAEQLEQLRALEHGHKIQVLDTPYDTVGVDTPDDLKRVEQILTGVR